MNTKTALDKLDTKYKTFLENRKKVLGNTERKGDVRGEIRGFLAALRIAEVISELEFRLLYTYYTL